MIIFSKQLGNVIGFNDATLPATLNLFSLESWSGYTTLKAIITSFTVSAQGNFQFLHSLGGNIYLYVFGDRIGEATISGLAFDRPCDVGGATTGIERVLDFYTSQRIAQRRTPLKITLGARKAIIGYMVGMNAKIADPVDGIYEFHLSLLVPPSAHRLCTRASSSTTTASTAGGATTATAASMAPQPSSGLTSFQVSSTGGPPAAVPFAVSTSGRWTGSFAPVPSAGAPATYYQGVAPAPGTT